MVGALSDVACPGDPGETARWDMPSAYTMSARCMADTNSESLMVVEPLMRSGAARRRARPGYALAL